MRTVETSTAALLALALAGIAADSRYLVYVGTYTGGKSKGIYAYRLDAGTGKLEDLGLAAEIANPSFLAAHPNRRFLYAVNEVSDFAGTRSGAVTAFAIEPATGKLTQLNQVPSRGAGPCHISVDRNGKYVLVANYNGGSVAVFPAQQGGRLGEASSFVQHAGSSVNASRQRAPHAHYIHTSPNNHFAVVADLGLDQVLVYRFDASKGILSPNNPPYAKVNPGAGPRHFAFAPSGRFGYVLNEIEPGVTAFAWNGSSGTLKEIATVPTLPRDYALTEKDSGAEIAVHPSGKFLYASNRGHNSIAVFAINSSDGTLDPVEHVSTQGRIPRGFGIEPGGRWLLAANQESDNLVLFRIDAKTGRLTPGGQTIEVGSPVSVEFVPLR